MPRPSLCEIATLDHGGLGEVLRLFGDDGHHDVADLLLAILQDVGGRDHAALVLGLLHKDDAIDVEPQEAAGRRWWVVLDELVEANRVRK